MDKARIETGSLEEIVHLPKGKRFLKAIGGPQFLAAQLFNRTRLKFLALVLVMLVSACVSFKPLELSDRTKTALGAMNREQSLEIIRRNLVATSRQGGFCLNNYADGLIDPVMSAPSNVSMSGTVISYTGQTVGGRGGSSAPGVGTVTVTVGSTARQLQADLSKLQEVRVGRPGYVCLSKEWPGPEISLIVIRDGMFHRQRLSVNVAPENVDQFIAAIKYIAPQAAFSAASVD
jgi:hypothetical protein